jgi:hypothetical protein
MTGTGTSKWTVENDPTSPSKGKVVVQSGRATYPLLVKNGSNVQNGFLEVQFKAISGSQDRAAGVVWRAKDADNYYVVRANALENNVVLYKTLKGERSALDIVGRKGGYGVNVPVPAQRWHRIRIEFVGTRFKTFFNGKLLFEVEDSTFGQAGQVGLCEGFRMPARSPRRAVPRAPTVGPAIRKPPRDETAGDGLRSRGRRIVPRTCSYGDLSAAGGVSWGGPTGGVR